jgi:hypothetical protein
VVSQYTHGITTGRGFRAKNDNAPVCVNSDTYLTFDPAPGIPGTTPRAYYEHPKGEYHNDHMSRNTDGLRFVDEEGDPTVFVTFNDLPLGLEATYHLIKEPTEEIGETSAHEEDLVLVNRR